MAIFDFLKGGSPRDQFARRVMARIRRDGWSGMLAYDAGTFSIRCGESQQLFLENNFAEWQRADRFEREKIMHGYGRMLVEMAEKRPDTWAAAASNVLPIVRNIGHVVNVGLLADVSLDGWDSPYQTLSGSIGVFLALDGATSMSLVRDEDLKTWGVGFAEALETAKENLRTRSPCKFERQAAGFYISIYEDYYDASRILLPDLFDLLDLRGDPVAIVVSRSALLIAGSDDAEGLQAMADLTEEAMASEPRAISQAAIVYRDGAWRPFVPGADQAKLRELLLRQELRDYAEQKEALDGYFERMGRDVYVATLSGREVDGRFSSWASWAWNAESLLPMADVFILGNEAGETIARYRADIERLVAFDIEPRMFPQRYAVRSAVDQETWAAIRNLPAPEDYPDTAA
jgi:uncharacterized protein YtpQ (UPF0354 family)